MLFLYVEMQSARGIQGLAKPEPHVREASRRLKRADETTYGLPGTSWKPLDAAAVCGRRMRYGFVLGYSGALLERHSPARKNTRVRRVCLGCAWPAAFGTKRAMGRLIRKLGTAEQHAIGGDIPFAIP